MNIVDRGVTAGVLMMIAIGVILAETGSGGDDGILRTLQEQALPELISSITQTQKSGVLRAAPASADSEDRSASRYLLLAYAQTPSEGVRCKILESVGKMRDPSLIPWLIKRINDPGISIQCFAIWALGEYRNPDLGIILRRRLWSPNQYVQMTAIDALGKLGRNVGIARDVGVFLRDTNVQIRFLSAKALSNLSGPEMVQELLDRLTNESSVEIQELLATTIGHNGGEAGVQGLIELLKRNPSSTTEHWIEVGLCSADPESVILALAPMLEGSDFRLKLSAARVLSELDSPAPRANAKWMEYVGKWAHGSDLVLQVAAQRYLEKTRKTR